ncbi:MCE family protein [bacterium]|nr:MCE family protein [bacterium]
MNRNFSTVLRVGIFVAASLTILVLFVFSIGGRSTPFSGKARYLIQFESTAGLYEGDPVLLTGVEIGNVSRIYFPESLEEKRIRVEISIDKRVKNRIRKDTKAHIGSASLVYGKVVALTPGSAQQPEIPEGGMIDAEEASGYKDIVDNTGVVVEDLQRIVAKLDRGQGALGVLLNEPLEIKKTLHHLNLSMQRISGILEGLEKGEGALGAALSDTTDFHQALEDFKTATGDLKEITGRLRSKRTLMGKMINDEAYGDSVTQDLKTAMHEIAGIATKLNSGKGSAGLFINDPSVYEGLQHVILGMEKSRMTRWMIQNRRKAGEAEERRQESRQNDANETSNDP